MKDKILGKIEELRGRMTGDRALEMKGKGRQVVGEGKRVGKEIAYDAERSQRPTNPPDQA